MKNFLRNLITSGLDSSADNELRRKIIFLNTIFLIGMIALPLYGARAYIDGKPVLCLVDYIITLICIIARSHSHYSKNPTFASYLTVIALCFLFLYLASIVGIYSIGWAYVFPLLALFLLGPRNGIFSIGCFLTGIIIFFIISPGPPFSPYPFGFKIRFVGSFLTVALFAYFFEHIRITFQGIFERKNRELEETSNELLYRAEFEHIITTLSSKFVRIEPEKIDEEISRVLKIIGEFAKVDRSYVFLSCKDGKIIDNTHEWCAEGIDPQIDDLQGFPLDDIPWIAQRYRNLEDVYVPSVENLPAEAHAEKELFTSLKIKSLVCVPLVNDRTFRGFLGFDSVKSEKIWSEEIIALLRIIGEIIIRSLDRIQSEEKKRQLEEQLLRSQKMEAVGQLAGGIAHDFNNILGAISGYAEMIKEKFAHDNPKLGKYTGTILSASSRAADLTAKLLAFSRRGKFRIVSIDMHEIILDVIKILHHTIDKKISFEKEIHAEYAFIKGDPLQIQNAVLNLAINARDAMPDGGTVTFKTDLVQLDDSDSKLQSQKLSPGTYLKLSVSDTGTGIEQNIKNKIFDPFFTTKEMGKGTGLGLASVYGTIKNHHGFIEVESEINKGTTFTLYIPATGNPSEKEEKAVSTDTVAASSTVNILVIDDEEFIRDMVEEMLTDAGYTVATAMNGRKGLEYYQSNHQSIDVIILDVVMPEMNGYDCFKELKKIDPQVRVIVSSGYSIDSEASKILSEGALEFIQKPYSRENFITVIEQALRHELI